MSEKTKNILFYVFAGVFVVVAMSALIVKGITGDLPLWLALVTAIAEVAMFIVGTIMAAKKIDDYEVALRKAEEEIIVLEDELKVSKKALAAAKKEAKPKKTAEAGEVAKAKTAK